MPEDKTINGYTITRIEATFGGPSQWRIKRPNGEEVARYPNREQAEQAARSFLPV